VILGRPNVYSGLAVISLEHSGVQCFSSLSTLVLFRVHFFLHDFKDPFQLVLLPQISLMPFFMNQLWKLTSSRIYCLPGSVVHVLFAFCLELADLLVIHTFGDG